MGCAALGRGVTIVHKGRVTPHAAAKAHTASAHPLLHDLSRHQGEIPACPLLKPEEDALQWARRHNTATGHFAVEPVLCLGAGKPVILL